MLNVNPSGKATLKIIQTYTPTSASDDDEVEEFYHQLDKMLAVKSIYTVMMGDFNAKACSGRSRRRDEPGYLQLLSITMRLTISWSTSGASCRTSPS